MVDQINQSALEQVLSLGGPELLLRLTKMFRDTVAERLDAADVAASEGRLDDVHRELHSMRSSAGNLGADILTQACLKVESGIKHGQIDDLAGSLREIRELHQRAYDELKTIAENSSGS